MRVEITLRFENDHVHCSDPPDQAWFSDQESDTQLYMAHGLWVAMGRPETLEIELGT